MPNTAATSQISQMIADNATQTAILNQLKELLAEAKAERAELRKRIEDLERWKEARETADEAVEKSQQKTHQILEVAFKVGSVLATLIGAAWALFIRGERR